MKMTKKLVALLLVLTLAVSVACMPAAASNQYSINKYVALGDSIATGMNEDLGPLKVPTDAVDENGEPVLVEIFGSNGQGYTDCVARALDLTNGESYFSYAHTGLRTNEIRYMLDASYGLENTLAGDFNDMIEALRPELLQNLKEADLITLNVGENDVFTIPMVAAVIAALLEQAESEQETAQLQEAQTELNEAETGAEDENPITGALGKLGPEVLAKFVKYFIPLAFEGYKSFKENFDAVLAELRVLNPDAQIVVLGMFNPLIATLKNDLISALDGLDAVVTPMNTYMALTCAKYGCTFVPMTDLQIDSTLHPSNEGYQKMADRIVSTLKTQTAFSDVSNLSNEFKTAINWAVQTGVTEGTSATTFSPNDTCTRAEIVTFLWRMARRPAPTTAENPFKDVQNGAYYYNAVLWAVENGITNGTSDDKFSPDQTCTRAQIVTFLYRYDQKFNPDAQQSVLGGTSFRDVSPAAYYGTPVMWAVKNGITKGTGAFLFAPLAGCTRAQAVTFLYRYKAL